MAGNALHAKLDALNVALDELEAQLDPLFAQSLPDTVVGLETLQQAKLQVALPYVVHGLTFVYLKTKGIDPKTHPVFTELDRIKQYFQKIKNAETPAKRTTEVDKAAAARFIKHAIGEATSQQATSSSSSSKAPTHIRFDADGHGPPTPTTRVPVKVTDKMRARADYESDVKEADEQEEVEEELEVFGDPLPTPAAEFPATRSANKKGKAKAEESAADAGALTASKKRRRPAVDVFSGLVPETETGASPVSTRSGTPAGDADNVSNAQKKKRKKTRSIAA